MRISRARVRELFGPTTGDRVRLGDTDLWAEVEQDLARARRRVRVRRRQDAARRPRHATAAITRRGGRARLRDHATRWSIDAGARASSRATSASRTAASSAIGKAGNPRRHGRRRPAPGRRREHRRALGRGHDRHRRRRSTCTSTSTAPACARRRSRPASRRCSAAGSGRSPSASPRRARRTSARMLQAAEAFPLNFGFLGKGIGLDSRAAARAGPRRARSASRSTRTGARCRRSIHASLDAGDELDIQVQIHTDTLNESGFFERHDGRDRRPHDPHLPLRGRRRRPRARHHPGGGRGQLPAVLDEPDQPVHASTRSTSTSTW